MESKNIISCSSCGGHLSLSMKICPYCGVAAQSARCPQCGSELPPGSRFCFLGCGELSQIGKMPVKSSEQAPPKKPGKKRTRKLVTGFIVLVILAGLTFFLVDMLLWEPQRELEAFSEAKLQNTLPAWDSFLVRFPNGAHADLARSSRDGKRTALLASINAVLEVPFATFEELVASESLVGFKASAASIPLLEDLPNIRRIAIRTNEEDTTERTRLKNFRGLLGAKQLRELDLSNTPFTDLNMLSGMVNLEKLSLDSTGVVDLSALVHLTSITALYLRCTKVTDISPLATLTGLAKLSISGTDVTDISPLASLTSLTDLRFAKTKVTDISPLASLTSLTDLRFAKTKVTDISPLATLTGLTLLSFSDTKVTDISPLATLTGLAELYISGTRVSDISPLATLTGLTKLDIAGTGVSDISPLATLTGLTLLDFSHTKVTDISPLVGLTKLRDLKLSMNYRIWCDGSDISDQRGRISNLGPLEGLSNLRELVVSGNPLTERSFQIIGGLTNLESLDMSGIRLKNLSHFRALRNLKSIYLESTLVTDLSPLEGIPIAFIGLWELRKNRLASQVQKHLPPDVDVLWRDSCD